MSSLASFFTPNSVAVIGASATPKKLGYAVVDNLVNGGYLKDGRKVYPINPKADTILGQKAYPSVTEVPGPIDLAVIVIPYMLVPDALRDVRRERHPGGGRHQCRVPRGGREGLERERELLEISRHLRDPPHRARTAWASSTPSRRSNASFSAGMPPGGPDGLHVAVGGARHRHPRLGAGGPARTEQVRLPGQQGRRQRDRPAPGLGR